MDKMNEFRQEMQMYNSSKNDVDESVLAMSYRHGRFHFNGNPVNVSATAVRQLCLQRSIPADFFINVMTADERAGVFNRLTENIEDDERLYRFSGNTLYGFLSTRYKRLDNILIMDIIQSAQDSGIGLSPVQFNLNPDHTKVRLLPLDVEVGELCPMIEITNSENGMGSLQIWAGVYRYLCTNGMMVPVGDITKAKWMHKGINEIELPDIGTVLNRSIEYVERMNESRSEYLSVTDKAAVIVDVAKSLGRKVAAKVVEVANTEYNCGRTRFDAVNAITRAAQFFQPVEQTAVEQYAHTLLAA